MRILLLPLLSLGLLSAAPPSGEPSEAAMRAAFETALAAQVRSAMDFVAESSGAQAVERIHQAGTDRFALNGFKKHDCMRSAVGHICGFAVDLAVVNGTIQQTVRGRFLPGPDGRLTFAQEG